MKMTLERSILITLAAQEQSIQNVKSLTELIGEHSGLCRKGYEEIGERPGHLEDWEPWPNGSESHMRILYDQKGFRKTHMWYAFQQWSEDEDRSLNDDEVSAYLLDQGCVHCTRAWWFARERKKEKKSLKGFRISLRAYGKSAIKKLGG